MVFIGGAVLSRHFVEGKKETQESEGQQALHRQRQSVPALAMVGTPFLLVLCQATADVSLRG
jgi:hypothetical protein